MMTNQKFIPQELFDYIYNPDVGLHMRQYSGHDGTFFEIMIEEIKEYGDNQIQNIFGVFEDILKSDNKNLLRGSQGMFKLTFNDFNSDSRALYDIEEVRKRTEELLKKIQYFFYFFHPDTILLLAMCSLNYTEKDGYGTFNNDKIALSNFLIKYFPYMNVLTEEAGFSSEEEDKLSKAILNKFGLD